jgi:epoxide hydrolase
VLGVHVTQISSFPTGDPSEMADLTEEEQTELGTLQRFYENKMSFNTLMAQQPQTLSFALLDSPVGLLAWNAQLLGEDLDPELRPHERDAVLADRHGGLRGPAVHENAHATPPTEPTTVPIGLAAFSGDFSGIRRFANRDHKNIVRWSLFEGGGRRLAPAVVLRR